METKCIYEAPQCEVYELETEGAILNASNEGFNRDEEIGWG